MFVLTLVLALQQPQAQAQPSLPPSPVARIAVTPERPVVVAGDSLVLRGEAQDSAGHAVLGARVRCFPGGFGSFEGHIDTANVLHAGARGTMHLVCTAILPGYPAARPRDVFVRIDAPPAARVALAPAISKLMVGQRVRLSALVLAPNGDIRDDDVRWSSTRPGVVRVES